jgi:uncharacterized protein YkwD
MKRSGTAASSGLAITLALLAGCAAGADGAPGGGGIGCMPGTPNACICMDGTQSTQMCDATGAAYGVCTCSPLPTPPGAGAAPNAAAPMNPATPTTTTPPPSSSGAPMTTTPPPAQTTPPPTAVQPPPMMEPMGTAGSSAPMAGSSAPMMPPPVTGDEGVPAGTYCASVASWDAAWTAFEDEVLTLTNAARAKGATCGQYGSFEAAGPLMMSAILRCSSRLHSKDMGEKNYFAHDNLEGKDPFQRMAAAGYSGFTMGENIAKGQQTPKEVVDGWMNSPEIGVGYFQGMSTSTRFNSNKLWTQNFGAPRRR